MLVYFLIALQVFLVEEFIFVCYFALNDDKLFNNRLTGITDRHKRERISFVL